MMCRIDVRRRLYLQFDYFLRSTKEKNILVASVLRVPLVMV